MSFFKKLRGKFLVQFLLVHVIAVVFLIVFSKLFGCILMRLTGISCPGCGLSRAYISFFKLDLRAAFAYHPLFFLLPPYVLYMLYRLVFHFPGSKRLTVSLTVTMAVLLVGVWILRLLLNDPVVAFSPENSVLYRILHP